MVNISILWWVQTVLIFSSTRLHDQPGARIRYSQAAVSDHYVYVSSGAWFRARNSVDRGVAALILKRCASGFRLSQSCNFRSQPVRPQRKMMSIVRAYEGDVLDGG